MRSEVVAAALDQTTVRRRGTGLRAWNRAKAGSGFTLIAPQTSSGAVFLIDMAGEVVHRWTLPCRPGRHSVLLDNGNLGYNGYLEASPELYPAWSLWHGGRFMEVSPAGEVVWSFEDPSHHHDAQWLPNGNLLYGAVELAPAELRRRLVGGAVASDLPDGALYCDVVREVDRQGRLVWEWKASEHLDPALFPIPAIFDRHHWPLINGLGVTRDGLVLMSLRTTSGIIGVDRGSGKTVFHLGADIVSHQHSPVELENGDILAFDNGNFRSGSSTPFSRVVAVDPVSRAVTWQYVDPVRPSFFSPYMGAAQRLPGGNTHITESSTGRLFDVTPEGEIVWEYVIPFFGEYGQEDGGRYSPGQYNTVFRSYRYQAEQIPWLDAAARPSPGRQHPER